MNQTKKTIGSRKKRKSTTPQGLASLNTYSKTRKKTALKKKLKSVLLVFLWGGFIFTIIGFVGGIALVAKFTEDLPDPTKPFERGQTEPSIFYDRNGKFLYKQIGDVDRDLLQDISEVPDRVKWSFLLAENKRYYEDPGVDIVATARCFYVTYLRKGNCGGSTITQQILKNTVFKDYPYDTKTRKIKEMILALRLNQLYSKDTILTFYLNEVNFSPTSYGVKTAARYYFNKDLDQLTLGESTFLAGLPQNWTIYSPYSSKQIVCREKQGDSTGIGLSEGQYSRDENGKVTVAFDGSTVIETNPYKCRQLFVLNEFEQEQELLKDHGINIPIEDIQSARTEELAFVTPTVEKNAPHFIDYAIGQLIDENAIFIDDKPLTMSMLNERGYNIFTTIDLDIQNIAQKAVFDGAESNKKNYGAYNSSLGAIDSRTGEVLAMVGSKGYNLESEGKNANTGISKFDGQVNIMNSLQQPGSSMKPISEVAGFENGSLYPSAFIPDVPYKVGNYTPQNAFGGGVGYSAGSTKNFLRDQLRASYNRPAFIAQQIMGNELVFNMFNKLGYSTFKDVGEIVPTTILGANDILPIEHINAYATLGNLGISHPVQTILRIEDKNGNILWKYEPEKLAKQVIDSRAAYLMNDVIKESGPAKYYSRFWIPELNGYIRSGKTGTTNDSLDNWYVGYSKHISVGVWSGNNDNSAVNLRSDGATLSLPIYNDFMKQLVANYPDTYKKNDDWEKPSGITEVTVCNYSGLPASSTCDKTSKSMFLADKLPAVDDSITKIQVCTDKPASYSDSQAKLNDQSQKMKARDIDIQYNFAKEDLNVYIKMPKAEMQDQIDKLLKQSPSAKLTNCDTDYVSLNLKPIITIASPQQSQSINIGEMLIVNASATGALGDVISMKAYLDNNLISTSSGNSLVTNININNSFASGLHLLKIEATDVGGSVAMNEVSIRIVNPTQTLNGILTITSPASGSSKAVNTPFAITAKYAGSTDYTNVILLVNGTQYASMTDIGNRLFQINYTPTSTGNYIFLVNYVTSVGTLSSSPISINVI